MNQYQGKFHAFVTWGNKTLRHRPVARTPPPSSPQLIHFTRQPPSQMTGYNVTAWNRIQTQDLTISSQVTTMKPSFLWREGVFKATQKWSLFLKRHKDRGSLRTHRHGVSKANRNEVCFLKDTKTGGLWRHTDMESQKTQGNGVFTTHKKRQKGNLESQSSSNSTESKHADSTDHSDSVQRGFKGLCQEHEVLPLLHEIVTHKNRWRWKCGNL